jgi:predicted nucleic acid-binding protein
VYLDSAYIAKYYVNEPDSPAVRKLIQDASRICSSAWVLVEVSCVFHRHVREGALSAAHGREVSQLFRNHVKEGFWGLVAITPTLLERTAAMVAKLPKAVTLRAGDAIHLATAIDQGESEVWTNDRHLLSAAGHVGLTGRRV